jgi:predicted RNA-binding Zn-ribbon protein involved in translation (DUF1610 family)
VTICGTCGTNLESVAGEPRPAVEPQEDAVQESSWKCPQCGQSVPGRFEICWNCGTDQDGVPDPGFSNEAAATGKSVAHPCPRCGSAKIIPNARMFDPSPYSARKLQVEVEADPNALIFKDRRQEEVTADICGDCGHVELTVAHPQELYEHYLRSKHG